MTSINFWSETSQAGIHRAMAIRGRIDTLTEAIGKRIVAGYADTAIGDFFITKGGITVDKKLSFPEYRKVLHLLCSYGMARSFEFAGNRYNLCDMILATGTSLASPALQFAMRIHCHCEKFPYIQGHNRNWAADLFEECVALHIFDEPTVVKVIDFLRNGDGLVVMDYSTTDSFLSERYIGLRYDYEKECYAEQLTREELWDRCTAKLLVENQELEITPENLKSCRYGAPTIQEFVKHLLDTKTVTLG